MDRNRPRPNIDGITPRQPRKLIGDFKQPRPSGQYRLESGRSVSAKPSASEKPKQPLKKPTLNRTKKSESVRPNELAINFSDIDESQESATKKTLWSRIRKKRGKKRNFYHRWARRIVFASVIIAVGIGSFLAVKLFFATQNIIDRQGGGALALNDNIAPSQLRGEGDGRVNILLIGIGGDNHTGGELADTIIVASIDPFAKEVSMLSIPRDLWVPIPGQWTTKINAAHALGEEDNFNEPGYPKGGPGLLQKTVEEVLDIPIHYFVRVDFDGFKQAVDAVGGITVDVPETVCDYKISWQFGFDCIYAGEQKLDPDHALFYARTRATTRGDFDRGERQRLILMALRDEVLKAGTFANPLKISSLLDAAGNHVKTNLSISEMLRIYEIGKDIPAASIISTGLDDYVQTANINGASVVIPKAGVGNFSEIQKYVHSIFIDGFIRQEQAKIDVLNGTDLPGLATETAEKLRIYGYDIGNIDDSPEAMAFTVIYDLSEGQKPYTLRYLEQRFNVKAASKDELPEGIFTDSDIVIILGNNAKP